MFSRDRPGKEGTWLWKSHRDYIEGPLLRRHGRKAAAKAMLFDLPATIREIQGCVGLTPKIVTEYHIHFTKGECKIKWKGLHLVWRRKRVSDCRSKFSRMEQVAAIWRGRAASRGEESVHLWGMVVDVRIIMNWESQSYKSRMCCQIWSVVTCVSFNGCMHRSRLYASNSNKRSLDNRM